MNSTKKKELLFWKRTEKGLIDRLYFLERNHSKETDLKLKKRLSNEIEVIKYDLDLLKQLIEEKQEAIKELEISISTEETKVKEEINVLELRERNPYYLSFFFLLPIAVIFLNHFIESIQISDNAIITMAIIYMAYMAWMTYTAHKSSKKLERKYNLDDKRRELRKAKNEANKMLQLVHFAGKDNTKDSSDYGTHQKNRDWIISTYLEAEKNFTSENKAIGDVKDKYWEQFGLKISPNTIRRYNDLID